jgi:hypothetical protein
LAFREKALNRLCERIISDVRATCRIKASDELAQKRFSQIYSLVQEGDDIVAELFNDWRRSTVFIILCGWMREGLLTQEEFGSLSDERKNAIQQMAKIKYYR